MMYRPALTAAFIFAIIGVMVGAMGAHALRPALTAAGSMDTFETAVKYQFYHSFALAFGGALYIFYPSAWIRRATIAFILGIILFSGSIYLLVYLKTTQSMGLKGLGILTPIGGVCFILGWLFLLFGIHGKRKGV
jgi:uncharacterized membrane protein YgdD (TMEM256/DUF423 family)